MILDVNDLLRIVVCAIFLSASVLVCKFLLSQEESPVKLKVFTVLMCFVGIGAVFKGQYHLEAPLCAIFCALGILAIVLPNNTRYYATLTGVTVFLFSLVSIGIAYDFIISSPANFCIKLTLVGFNYLGLIVLQPNNFKNHLQYHVVAVGFSVILMLVIIAVILCITLFVLWVYYKSDDNKESKF